MMTSTFPRVRPARSVPALARRVMAGAVLLAVLAGCQATQTGGGSGPDEQAPLPTVPAARAVTLFETVCGGSLPGFAGAERRMASVGVTNKLPSGTVFSESEDLSFRILDGPGSARTCSMVFTTTESASRVQAAFAALGQFENTRIGPVARYRGDRVLVLQASPARRGDRTYYNLRMLSERN